MRGLENDFRVLADEGLAGGEHLIEESQETLAFDLGEGFADGQADDVAVADQTADTPDWSARTDGPGRAAAPKSSATARTSPEGGGVLRDPRYHP